MENFFIPSFEEVTRKAAYSCTDSGYDPENLPLEKLMTYGIINLDKPKGPTSHQVSDYVQKILGITKAGHSGTLDPSVTGVLPIAIGHATRIVQFLLTAGKEYVCIMHLHKVVDKSTLRSAIEEMTGEIEQLPPVKSAVKRQLRTRNVYYVHVHEIDDKDVLFTIGCQAGTYIRKWVHDLGVKLGTGAHMAELRRTHAGPFGETDTITLQDLSDNLHWYRQTHDESYIRQMILPIERGVQHLPKVYVFDSAVPTLCHGANLSVPGISRLHTRISVGDTVAVMTLKNELIGVGTSLMSTEEMLGEQGVAVDLRKVFMEPERYPKSVDSKQD